VARCEPEQVLAGLSAAQRRAVTTDAGLLCVVAGAGSGKTTVLTRRVAWRVVTGSARAEHVLVLTFTRKAAGELRLRLGRLGVGSNAGGGVWAATFHSAAYRMLRRHWADEGRAPPSLLADPGRMLRRLLGRLGFDPLLAPALAGEMSWARARLVGAEHYPRRAEEARRSCPLPAEQVARLMDLYEEEKRRRRVVDLDDLVLRCGEMLEGAGPAAEAVRWQVRHLFVDEFQDVNPAQWRLLDALRAGRPDLCVVGDERQAIYAWNGSDPSLLGRLATLVPGTETVHLDENHRSSPQVVRAAAAVLAPAPGARAVRADGPPPLVRGFPHESAEAHAVARWLRTTRRPGQPWRHLAVLARTHARLDPLGPALAGAGIPHRRAGVVRRTGPFGAVLVVLGAMPHTAPLHAALVDALEETDPGAPAGAAGAGGAEELSTWLAALVDEHGAEEERPTVGSFLAWMAANDAHADAEPDIDAVTLATFHQAKGLQWWAVAVVGLEEGTMPIAYATDETALAEERRLLYVALTRAEEQLWCSWASQTGDGARQRPRGPSPFLDAVRAVADLELPPPPAAGRARVSELRQRLAASS
jgi:DNA helicase-2/ATP-dependent DNA helicase PcrA